MKRLRPAASGAYANVHGFTLIEVMIALLVIGLVLGGFLFLATQQAQATARYRDKQLGEWVASNVLNEVRLREVLPNTGQRTGQAPMGSRQFSWRMQISATPDPGMRRIEVNVMGEDGYPVAQMIGIQGNRR